MGAAAWKHQIDAFLYYGITEWEKGEAVKTNTWNDGYDLTFTDDLRANGFMNAQEAIDMEGQLALPGPANSANHTQRRNSPLHAKPSLWHGPRAS